MLARNRLHRCPQAQGAQHDAGKDEESIEAKHDGALPGAEPLAIAHPQPEDAGKTIREPADKQGAQETQQTVEDGNGLGNDHGERPHGKSHAEPRNDGDFGAADQVLAVAEDAAKDVLARDVAVNNTSNDNRGDGNAPDGLAHGGRAGSQEGGGWDVGTDVDVDDDGGDNVEGGVGDLEQGEGLGEIVGILKLANDAKEARVARCMSLVSGSKSILAGKYTYRKRQQCW